MHGVAGAAAHTNAVARDVASSKDRREAQRKLWAVWQRLEFGTWIMRIARALVCIYFMNLSYDDVLTFRYAFIVRPHVCQASSLCSLATASYHHDAKSGIDTCVVRGYYMMVYCPRRQSRTPEYLKRAQKYPRHYKTVQFPWLEVLVLTPCAVLAALGVKVPWTASALVCSNPARASVVMLRES